MLQSTKARVGAVISLVLPYLVTATFIPHHQEILGLASPGQEESHILRRIQVHGNSTVTLNDILGAAQGYNLDVWQVRSSSVDVHLTPAEQTQLDHIFEESGITYTDSLLPNSLVYPQSVRPQVSTWNLSSLSNTTFHTDYRTTEEIGTFVKELIDLYPDQARLVPIGHSSEHREMFALEITANQTSFKKKTGFVITGAQHAREWIATSTALFIAHALLADPSESYSMASLLATFDFYLVLLPNPDGYVYTWETDRFWYKNRQVVGPNAKCVGIDMNRNWGYKWKSKALFPAKKKNKTGTDPCAPWFPGHRAWEAPEVNNIANYITTLPNVRAHIDLRSYGQMISSPYSFSCKKTPKDAEDQLEAALGASQALKAAHGTSFTTGSLCSLLYKAPGNIIDYLYARAGIKYSYAVHLRDTGTYGFVLPPEWIRPVGEETANMIKSLAGFVVGKKF